MIGKRSLVSWTSGCMLAKKKRAIHLNGSLPSCYRLVNASYISTWCFRASYLNIWSAKPGSKKKKRLFQMLVWQCFGILVNIPLWYSLLAEADCDWQFFDQVLSSVSNPVYRGVKCRLNGVGTSMTDKLYALRWAFLFRQWRCIWAHQWLSNDEGESDSSYNIHRTLFQNRDSPFSDEALTIRSKSIRSWFLRHIPIIA